jgi:hypothetical protein
LSAKGSKPVPGTVARPLSTHVLANYQAQTPLAVPSSSNRRTFGPTNGATFKYDTAPTIRVAEGTGKTQRPQSPAPPTRSPASRSSHTLPPWPPPSQHHWRRCNGLLACTTSSASKRWLPFGGVLYTNTSGVGAASPPSVGSGVQAGLFQAAGPSA